MSVGTFVQPDHTSQDGTTYKISLEGVAAVVERLAACFAPHAQAVPNMTVVVDAGAVFLNSNNALSEVGQQTSAAITAPVSNPRIDRVVVNALTGAISVVTGTEASSPAPPAIPAGSLPVCQVALTRSQTAITNANLTDERQLAQMGLSFPVAAAVPPGVYFPFGGMFAPSGYLLCDGAAVSRATYAVLFAALCLLTTGNTQSGSPIVSAIPNTANLQPGMPISGTNIPAGTTIASVDSGSQIHLSQNAVGNGSGVALQVCPNGVGDGANTFNVPDMRQKFPLGLAASGTGSLLGGTGGQIDHTHSVSVTTPTLSLTTGGYYTPADSGNNPVIGGSISGGGSGSTGANNPPFRAANFIIKT